MSSTVSCFLNQLCSSWSSQAVVILGLLHSHMTSCQLLSVCGHNSWELFHFYTECLYSSSDSYRSCIKPETGTLIVYNLSGIEQQHRIWWKHVLQCQWNMVELAVYKCNTITIIHLKKAYSCVSCHSKTLGIQQEPHAHVHEYCGLKYLFK